MPQDNPVTDLPDVTDRSPVTSTPAADKGNVLAPKDKAKQNAAAKPKVQTLFIYDASLGAGPATAIRDAFYKGARIEPISAWADLVRVLSKFSQIGTLVIDTHSIPGSLLINANSPTPAEQAKRLAASGVTVTGRIIFEGCSIMGNPAEVAKIISGIAGPNAKATGYTLFSVVQELELPVDNNTEEEINLALDPFRTYLLPGGPSAKSLAGKKTTAKYYRRWFRRDLVTTSPEDEADPRAIKARSDLSDQRVRTPEEAETVRSEFESPVEPALIVTIENIAAVAGQTP